MAERLDRVFVDLKQFVLGLAGSLLPGDWYAHVMPVLAAFLSAMGILLFAPATMMYLTWLERKVVARIQDRYGPNRVGPFGVLQPIADGIKMVLKEDIIPAGSDKLIHMLTPVFAVAPVLSLFLVLPFGRDMIAADLNVGVLFFLAMSAVQTPIVIAAGWGARSKFSVLGSMRAAATILSYEIPMVIVLIPVVMMTGTMSVGAIVEAQAHGWFGFTPWGAACIVVFILGITAESNRTPFDMAEAESELVAGFHTEYSGFKFALFQMAEFLSAFAAGGLIAALFLGGWRGPEAYLPEALHPLVSWVPSWIWFQVKMYTIFFVLIWFRGTLPRFRVDQLLAIAWKLLFPFSLLILLATAAWYWLLVAETGPHSLGQALASNVVLLVGGWMLLSVVIEREFVRINRPKVMAHAS